MTMLIGHLADRAGVAVDTVRFYERRGLLETPPRSAAGYRLYDQRSLGRVRFIKRAQALGFSLSEISELLSLQTNGAADCADYRPLVDAKIAEIDAKLRDLRRMKRALEAMTARCPGSGPLSECPIVDALQPGDSTHPHERR